MPVEIRVPQMGESVFEVTVGRWLKHVGDTIAAGEDIVELETDKANAAVSSEQGGVLERIVHQAGETVAVNEVLAVVSGGEGGHPTVAASTSAASTEIVPADVVETEAKENGSRKPHVSPVAERVAAERGVDPAKVPGTGPGGRVMKGDVVAYAPATSPSTASQPASGETSPRFAPEPPTATQTSPGPRVVADDPRDERKPMTRRRQIIAERLKQAQHQAAMLTTFNEVDMSAVMEVRKRRKDSFKERHGVGLGFMSFFTKAAIGALKAFPLLNAEIDGNDMVVKHHYDIGIAVGAKEGLVVPVVRDADQKTFAALEKEILDLATRARENRLTIHELTGGTFTLTNGGVFGSLLSTPILNTPQVGILGMHKIEERPIALAGQVVIRPMMYLALSYDHRIVDGSEAVRFLVRVKELIEDPESLLLEG